MLKQRAMMCLKASRPLSLTVPLKSLRLGALGASHSLCTPYAAQYVALKQQKRFYSPSSLDEPAKIVDFKAVSNSLKDPNTAIVDVREADEYHKGHIPGAFNIPFRSSPGALGLEDADFEEAFGFPKPDQTKNLIFYCLSGVRSTGAEQLAATYGYNARQNYEGSFSDWVANGGAVEAEAEAAPKAEAGAEAEAAKSTESEKK